MLRPDDLRALILPHNHRELVAAQIAILRGEPVELYPDFAEGGLMDAEDYRDGRGSIRLRARLRPEPEPGRIRIVEIPYSTTPARVARSIEKAASTLALPIREIEAHPMEEGGIVLHLEDPEATRETVTALYRHTCCELRITARPIVLRQGHPVELPFSEILRELTRRLEERIEEDLKRRLFELQEEHRRLTLSLLFVEKGWVRTLVGTTSRKELEAELTEALGREEPGLGRQVRPEDLESLLAWSLGDLACFERGRARRRLEDLEQRIHSSEDQLRDPRGAAVAYLEELLEELGERCPRRTTLARFGPDPGALAETARLELAAGIEERILVATRAGLHRLDGRLGTLLLTPSPPRPAAGSAREAVPDHILDLLALGPGARLHRGARSAYLEVGDKVVVPVTLRPTGEAAESEPCRLPGFLALSRPRGLSPHTRVEDVVRAALITATLHRRFDRLVLDADSLSDARGLDRAADSRRPARLESGLGRLLDPDRLQLLEPPAQVTPP